jgi:hypothetical protein
VIPFRKTVVYNFFFWMISLQCIWIPTVTRSPLLQWSKYHSATDALFGCELLNLCAEEAGEPSQDARIKVYVHINDWDARHAVSTANDCSR